MIWDFLSKNINFFCSFYTLKKLKLEKIHAGRLKTLTFQQSNNLYMCLEDYLISTADKVTI